MTLILAFALLQDADRIDEWVRQLGAEAAEARDEAQKKLLEAGETALPALRKAAEAAADAEIQVRAAALVKEIGDSSEVRSLIAPPRVTLERGRHTLSEAVETLRAAGRTVDTGSLNLGEPIEFGWKETSLLQALDELCAAHGKLTYTVGKEGTITLGTGTPSKLPAGHGGPIRVDVTRINETRGTDFGDNNTGRVDVALKIASLHGDDAPWNAKIVVTEAQLESGATLKPEKSAADAGGLPFIGGGGAVVHILGAHGAAPGDQSFAFTGVPRSAGRIASIRGTVELTMPVGEQLVEFSEDQSGTTVTAGDYTLKLESFKRGKAAISFKDERAKADAAIDEDAMWVLEGLAGMDMRDGRKSEIERRVEFSGVVGIDADGNEHTLEAGWKKPGNVRGAVILNGRRVNAAGPTMEVEAAGEIQKIRLKFKPRSYTYTVPFEIKEVPLP